jgi:hypothetical protein
VDRSCAEARPKADLVPLRRAGDAEAYAASLRGALFLSSASARALPASRQDTIITGLMIRAPCTGKARGQAQGWRPVRALAGRAEEALALRAARYSVRVVPGVTSRWSLRRNWPAIPVDAIAVWRRDSWCWLVRAGEALESSARRDSSAERDAVSMMGLCIAGARDGRLVRALVSADTRAERHRLSARPRPTMDVDRAGSLTGCCCTAGGHTPATSMSEEVVQVRECASRSAKAGPTRGAGGNEVEVVWPDC